MEINFHPLVKRDIIEALKYYSSISPDLADDFQYEVQFTISNAARNPLRFHPADSRLRRGNLRRFPYHILYEVIENSIRILQVRHNKRHPDYGMERK